jgi:DNA-directed RNA polymerase specialized sigma24 family protein
MAEREFDRARASTAGDASLTGMRDAYDELLRAAAGCSRSREEARDLLQTVFLQALERGAPDAAAAERRAWMRGALRRRAAFEARLAVRRRRREARWFEAHPAEEDTPSAWRFSAEFLGQLQPSVRVLAALASADLNPDEIRSVLRLSGTAFRKRLSMLRRFVREASEAGLTVVTTRGAVYALGPARAGLITSLRRRPQAVLGSHDPDGHLLIFAVQNEKTSSK